MNIFYISSWSISAHFRLLEATVEFLWLVGGVSKVILFQTKLQLKLS